MGGSGHDLSAREWSVSRNGRMQEIVVVIDEFSNYSYIYQN